MGLVFAIALYTAFPLYPFSCSLSLLLQNFRQGCCKGIIKCSQLLYIHHLPHSAPLFFCLLLVPSVYCKLNWHRRQLAEEACKRR